MKIVAPYRPFAPESAAHLRLGPFDWIDALRMQRTTALRFCGCDTFALTDVDTDLDVPAYSYVTERRRLMLWILEVSLRYLESDDFDQDTVMVSPDILVMNDLRPWFQADLGVVVRLDSKFAQSDRPLLNSVQWWSHKAKPLLVHFYEDALAIADGLSENEIRWGADTVPLVNLLSPLQLGHFKRAGMTVVGFSPHMVLGAYTSSMLRKAQGGFGVDRSVPLLDFKYMRKLNMREFFDLACPHTEAVAS